MKIPFLRPKDKRKTEETRDVVTRRLNAIKKGEKNETLTDDAPKLVKGLADGDG
jgi:hypothetical protein